MKDYLVTFQLKKIGKGVTSKKELVSAKDVASVQAFIREKYGESLLEIVATHPRPGWMDYIK